MASQNSFILAEEELSCPICFEEFSAQDIKRHPKLLLCLHTFCFGCMETLRKYDGTLQCSICRTSHTVYRIKDLMENYVIFEHLRLKQETDDETLAMQLRDEYDVALKRLQEQEERDAAFAREEEEKNKLELERQEREKKKNEEELRNRLEEERRRQEEETQRRLEDERIKREEQERINIEENERKINEGDEDSRVFSDVEDVSDDIYSLANTSDSDGESSEDSNDSSDNDEENPFHDVEEVHSDEEEAMIHIRSYSSLNSEDDYITIGNDSNNSGTISLSSGDEDDNEIGIDLSGTTPVFSENLVNLPEPDFLSEEFSGVAQPSIPKKASTDSLLTLLPSVQCCERADGSIVVLGSPPDNSAAGPGPSNFNKSSQHVDKSIGSRVLSSSTKRPNSNDCKNEAVDSDDNEWTDMSEDESAPNTRNFSSPSAWKHKVKSKMLPY